MRSGKTLKLGILTVKIIQRTNMYYIISTLHRDAPDLFSQATTTFEQAPKSQDGTLCLIEFPKNTDVSDFNFLGTEYTEDTIKDAMTKYGFFGDPKSATMSFIKETTDGTESNLGTIAIPTNTTVSLKASIVARRTGGSAGSDNDSLWFEMTGTYKNTNGTVSEVGAVETTGAGQDQDSWKVDYCINGKNVCINATGATDNTIKWRANVTVTEL